MAIEKTLVIIKPDGVELGDLFLGDVKARIKKVGLSILQEEKQNLSPGKCSWHYQKDDKWYLEEGMRILKTRKASGLEITKSAIEYGREITERIVTYMTSGPCILMLIEGEDAIQIIKDLVGTATEPSVCAEGTLRRIYGRDTFSRSIPEERAIRNLIHRSGNKLEAEREIRIWFGDQ